MSPAASDDAFSSVTTEILARLSDDTVADMLSAIEDGQPNAAAALGFDDDALASIENTGRALYLGGKYPDATKVFFLVTRLDPARSTAWRGLGACCHAQKAYQEAANCYATALRKNPKDVISCVYLGETLCTMGEREAGMGYLKAAIGLDDGNAVHAPYITRAKAIIKAGGGAPPKIHIQRHGQDILPGANTGDAGAAAKAEAANFQPEPLGDLRRDPRLRDDLEAIAQLMLEGKLKPKDVGNIPDEQLKAGYISACRYVDIGQYDPAIRILTFLLLCDPQNADYLQLFGIIMHRQKLYGPATMYYDLANTLVPNNPSTLTYLGECMLMQAKNSEARAHLDAAVAAAGQSPEHKEISARAHSLLARIPK